MAETLKELVARAKPVQKGDSDKCDLLSVQFMLTHQRCGRPPHQIRPAFGILCETNGQAYSRDVDLTEERIPLDTGWLKEKVGYVVIENLAPASTQKDEEPAVVHIWIDGVKSPLVVRYGRFTVIDIDEPSRVELSASKPAVALVNVIPR